MVRKEDFGAGDVKKSLCCFSSWIKAMMVAMIMEERKAD
jgi:hypothetical protein